MFMCRGYILKLLCPFCQIQLIQCKIVSPKTILIHCFNNYNDTAY